MESLGLTIYLTGRAPILGDIAAAAQGPAMEADGDFVCTLAGGRLRLNRLADEGRGRHIAGLAGYLESCDIHDRTLPSRLARVEHVLGVVAEPGVDLARDALPFAQRLLRGLDGFLFVRGVLLDRQLRCLARPPTTPAPARTPPTADRVLARARVLGMVARRAFLEPSRRDDELVRLRSLVARPDLADELEDAEHAIIVAPRGALSQRQVIDASWRIEGLAVLAWALDLRPLGALDEESEAVALVEAVDGVTVAALRSMGEIAALAARLLTIHWRLVEWRVNPRPIDLAGFVERASWGPLSIDGVPLLDKDLAIAGVAFAAAPAERIRLATSIARERHRAVKWLCGDDQVFSRISVET